MSPEPVPFSCPFQAGHKARGHLLVPELQRAGSNGRALLW